MGCSKNSVKREVSSNISLLQETREPSNNLILHLKQVEKNKIPPKEKGRNHKDHSRNKWKEMKETIAKINKTKTGSLRR